MSQTEAPLEVRKLRCVLKPLISDGIVICSQFKRLAKLQIIDSLRVTDIINIVAATGGSCEIEMSTYGRVKFSYNPVEMSVYSSIFFHPKEIYDLQTTIKEPLSSIVIMFTETRVDIQLLVEYGRNLKRLVVNSICNYPTIAGDGGIRDHFPSLTSLTINNVHGFQSIKQLQGLQHFKLGRECEYSYGRLTLYAKTCCESYLTPHATILELLTYFHVTTIQMAAHQLDDSVTEMLLKHQLTGLHLQFIANTFIRYDNILRIIQAFPLQELAMEGCTSAITAVQEESILKTAYETCAHRTLLRKLSIMWVSEHIVVDVVSTFSALEEFRCTNGSMTDVALTVLETLPRLRLVLIPKLLEYHYPGEFVEHPDAVSLHYGTPNGHSQYELASIAHQVSYLSLLDTRWWQRLNVNVLPEKDGLKFVSKLQAKRESFELDFGYYNLSIDLTKLTDAH